MNNDITYREATLADVELLTAMRVEFFRDRDIAAIADSVESGMMYTRNHEYFAETLSDGTFTAFLAFDGDAPIATSGVNFYKTPPNPFNPSGKTAYISNMYTKPEYRGKGIATRLFAMTMDEVKKRGCGKAVLHATSLGRPIYEKYGFFVPDRAMEILL
jgi:GNAT superfamily N-acetyltransferase